MLTIDILLARPKEIKRMKTRLSFTISNIFFAQSAGAVEYTDCTSAEG